MMQKQGHTKVHIGESQKKFNLRLEQPDRAEFCYESDWLKKNVEEIAWTS